MYNLPYHKERDERVVREFIDRHPFAFLTGCDSTGRPVATQLPVFIETRDDRTFLSGHIMRNTDHHKAFAGNDQVLAVFTGAHSYVSATWYSNPRVASTWNYMSVHARGTIRFLDQAGLESILQKTSLHFENHNPDSPTVFNNLPEAFKQKVIRAIVAFEIEVTGLDTVFKLSQDRDEQSYRNIMAELNKQGEDGRVVAAEMEKRITALFADKT